MAVGLPPCTPIFGFCSGLSPKQSRHQLRAACRGPRRLLMTRRPCRAIWAPAMRAPFARSPAVEPSCTAGSEPETATQEYRRSGSATEARVDHGSERAALADFNTVPFLAFHEAAKREAHQTPEDRMGPCSRRAERVLLPAGARVPARRRFYDNANRDTGCHSQFPVVPGPRAALQPVDIVPCERPCLARCGFKNCQAVRTDSKHLADRRVEVVELYPDSRPECLS